MQVQMQIQDQIDEMAAKIDKLAKIKDLLSTSLGNDTDVREYIEYVFNREKYDVDCEFGDLESALQDEVSLLYYQMGKLKSRLAAIEE